MSRTFAHSSAFASVVFALALSGCVFLVDSLPDDTSTTCHLTTPEFETTGPCATCITSNCQTPLNACCADSTCQGQLSNADQCGAGSCSALSAAAGNNSATDALISCIASACGSTCYGIDAGAVDGSTSTSCNGCDTHCDVNSDDTSCLCEPPSASEPGNKVSCTTSSIANSICCASPDYPNLASGSCECDVVWCDNSEGYCSCQIGVEVVGGTNAGVCVGDGPNSCCISADGTSCSCDPDNSCDQSGEMAVDECGSINMGCSATATRNESVTGCGEPQ